MLTVDAVSYKTPRATLWSIQYLRAIAALMVVFHHARTPEKWLFDPLANFSAGARGVDIFFVISGFVMFTAARNEAPVYFYVRRFVRVAPLYWIATLAIVLIHWLETGDGISRLHLLKSLLFIPFHNPSFAGAIWPMLVPGWTLNYEMFFYLIFGVGIALKRPVAVTAVTILGLVATGLLVKSSNAVVATYTHPQLLEFLAGVLLGKAYQNQNFSNLRTALPAGLIIFVAGQLIAPEAVIVTLFAASLIVSGSIAWERRGLIREHRVFKLLGDASYSIYLIHTIVIRLIAYGWQSLPLFGWWQFVGYVMTCIGTSIVAGVATYIVVEKPVTRHIRKMYLSRAQVHN